MSAQIAPATPPIFPYPTPYSEVLCNLGTIAYAIDHNIITAITSTGSMVFGAKGARDNIHAFYQEFKGECRVSVLTESAARIIGYTSWLANGLCYFIISVNNVALKIFRGAKALLPARLLHMLSFLGPITGIIAAGVLLIVDSKHLVRLLLELKGNNDPKECAKIKEELRARFFSWIANAAMLASACLVFSTTIAAPYLIITFGLIATLAHIYVRRDQFSLGKLKVGFLQFVEKTRREMGTYPSKKFQSSLEI